MATASRTNVDAKLENLVRCAICLDFYDDPRLLPCSHTFCYKCIGKLCEGGMGQCPMRDNSIIFQHTISRLPINRVAKDLVESFTKPSPSHSKCDHCQQILSEFHCQTCSQYYCTLCLKGRHDVNEFQSHQIDLIITDDGNHFCARHAEEKVKYWCEPCEEIVCSDCLLFQHRQHPFVSLTDFRQKIQGELQSSMKRFNTMKTNIERLTRNTSKALSNHARAHSRATKSIEQTFRNLQVMLEKRKRELIDMLSRKDSDEQQMTEEHKANIDEFLKTVLIRELLTKQLLKCEDCFQLIEMNNDTNNYNQLIEQQYQQLLQGHTFDLQQFTLLKTFANLEQQISDLGELSTTTFLADIDDIYPMVNLSPSSGHQTFQSLNETYAYGYRFHLQKSLPFTALRVKAKLFNCPLTIFVIDHNDILIQKEMFPSPNSNATTLQWLTIPIKCQLEHNYCLFLWASPTDELKPIVTCEDSDHNLRQVNEHVSIRSKRAQIAKVTDVQLNSKIQVLYDALCATDDEKEPVIPALEMILHI